MEHLTDIEKSLLESLHERSIHCANMSVEFGTNHQEYILACVRFNAVRETIDKAFGECELCEHPSHIFMPCTAERGDGYRQGREYVEALGPCMCKGEGA